MAKNKEYELAIKIAGEVERSFYNSTKLTQKELKNIAKTAAVTSSGIGGSFRKGLNETEGLFKGIEKAGITAFKVIGTAAAASAAGALVASAKIGMAFEEQMSTVEAISGASASEMDALEEKAKKIGKETKFTATEAGSAMEYMGMAGWKTKEMLDGIDGVMDLAAASGEDLALTSDIVTDALTAFNMKASDTNRFVDTLAKASSASNTNVAMMGETFKYVAPVAGAMGYSAEDTALAIGLMANSGIKASQAGTQLRVAMVNLAKPTDKQAAMMDLLGISITKDNGSMKSLMEVMEMLRSKIGTMTKKEQETAFATLTGIDTKKAAAEAMNNLTEEEIKNQTALGVGRDLIESYNAEQLNSALYKRYTKKELTKMTEEQKRNIVALEQGSIALEGMTRKEQVQASATIFGKEAMSGWLAIINAADGDFEKLAEEIYNSEGAAKQMAEVRLDNLAGDVTILKSAMEGFGIEIYENMREPLRSVTKDMTKKIGMWSKEFSNHLPTAIRHVKNFGKAFLSFSKPLIETGKWLVRNPEVIVSTLVGIGVTLTTYKIAKGIFDLSTALTSLSTAGLAVMGISTAITVIAGIASYLETANREAAKQNLAQHFGDITLSMQELEDAAKHIIGADLFKQLDEMFGAQEKSKAFLEAMNEASKNIETTSWKLSIGLTVSEEDSDAYIESAKEYVKNAQDYITNQGYTISIATKFLLGDSKQSKLIDAENSQFYKGLSDELSKLNTDLNGLFEKAMEDGLTLETDKKIKELLSSVEEITSAVSGAKSKATFQMLEVEFSGKALSAETMQNLQSTIATYIEEEKAGAQEALNSSLVSLNARLELGDITQIKYDEEKTAMIKGYYEQQADAIIQAQNFMINTLTDTYGEEIGPAIAKMNEEMQTLINDTLESGTYLTADQWEMAINNIVEGTIGAGTLSTDAKNAIKMLLEGMAPTTEQLSEVGEQMQELFGEVPKGISNAITKTENLEMVTGSTKIILERIGESISNSPEQAALIEAAEQCGNNIPDAIIEKVRAKAPEAQQTARSLLESIKTVLRQGVSAEIPINYKLVKNYMQEGRIPGFARGGIITEPTLATFAEEGAEAAIPLDGSAESIRLWEVAGKILGVAGKANAFEQFDLQQIGKGEKTGSFSSLLKEMSSGEVHNTNNQETVSVTISNQFYGTPTQEEVEKVNQKTKEDLEEWLESYLAKRARTSFR